MKRIGKISNGEIFVSAIQEMVRIRSGEWDQAAV